MGRQRQDRNMPPNLRVRDGYYSYRNPADGKEWGIGRDKHEAWSQAILANLASRTAPTLLDRINGTDLTWDKWCDRFEVILAERAVEKAQSANTVKQNKSKMNRLRSSFTSERAAKGIATADIAAALSAIKAEGKQRMAQSFRSFLTDCFDRMVAAGVRPDNPARVTDTVNVKVKRARLSLEVFFQVYNSPTAPLWLRNAMALALVSGQDRDTCCNARFADFRDGYWWNKRGKTGAKIMLPLHLRLDVFGMSLEDVIRQCRATGIVSQYPIHRTERAKGALLGSQIHIDTITREFTEEIEKLGIDWGKKTPPTFHEIRSLSVRLYEEQNTDHTPVNAINPGAAVNTKALLGHTKESTTDIYRDGRGDWVKANPKKPLPR